MIGHVVAFSLLIVGRLPQWYLGLSLLGVMLIDWSLQAFVNIPSTNMRRVITGFLGGLGVGILFWSGFKYIISKFGFV